MRPLTSRAAHAALFVLLALGVTTPAFADAPQVIGGPVLNPGNGHTYYLLSTSNWTDAETQAIAMGGNLATIRNDTENQWVESTFGAYGDTVHFLWIGFNSATSGGNYVWASGESGSYTNWAIGEPNDNGGNEYYAEVYPTTILQRGAGFPPVYSGQWNDVPDESYPYQEQAPGSFGPVYGVVEIVPEPATIGILVLGVVGLLLRHRRC